MAELMDGVKLRLVQLKTYLDKYNTKTKAMLAAGTIGIIALAVGLAYYLNQSEYTVLFSGVTNEEAAEIVEKLSEDGVDYQYQDNGDILVLNDVADEIRAQLVFEGYPKSGFTYDVFTENAGGMTTDTEKQQYILYELQDRIGATIRYFDGVQDAKVTIALKEEQRFVLQPNAEDDGLPSASVIVVMKDGGSPSSEQAIAIQRLVAKAVPGMEMENVGVFDGNGIDVTVSQENTSNSDLLEELARIIEDDVEKKIIKILAPFYGAENVKISVHGVVNMEKVMSETITYTVPEKIDEEDKTGIVSSENVANESMGSSDTAIDAVGTETNAEVQQFNGGTTQDGEFLTSEAAIRDYLVNQTIEQREIDQRVLDDLTISIAINSLDASEIPIDEIRDLVGNAAGVAAEDRQNKISIVSAPFYDPEAGVGEEVAEETLLDIIPLPAIIGIAVGLLVIIALVVFLVIRKKKKEREAQALLLEANESGGHIEEFNEKNERAIELREHVRDFVEENPEIAANMLKILINGVDGVG